MQNPGAVVIFGVVCTGGAGGADEAEEKQRKERLGSSCSRSGKMGTKMGSRKRSRRQSRMESSKRTYQIHNNSLYKPSLFPHPGLAGNLRAGSRSAARDLLHVLDQRGLENHRMVEREGNSHSITNSNNTFRRNL